MAVAPRFAVLFGVAALALLCPACVSHQLQPQPAAPSDEDHSFHDRLDSDVELSLEDYGRLYSPLGLTALGAGIAGAAPLANTSADQDVRDWYQHRIKRDGL